jgi:hypothetical protein
MDLQLHLLETFMARGSDGERYKVRAYERLVQDPSLPGSTQPWQPSGIAEFRLEDGRYVDVDAQGGMRIHGTDVVLQDERTAVPSS